MEFPQGGEQAPIERAPIAVTSSRDIDTRRSEISEVRCGDVWCVVPLLVRHCSNEIPAAPKFVGERRLDVEHRAATKYWGGVYDRRHRPAKGLFTPTKGYYSNPSRATGRNTIAMSSVNLLGASATDGGGKAGPGQSLELLPTLRLFRVLCFTL
jgi:hypothetical protein